MENKDPCFGCDCNDPDMGCTMSSFDRSYACPLEIKRADLERDTGDESERD